MRTTFRSLTMWCSVAVLATTGCVTALPDVSSGPAEPTVTWIAPVAVSGPEQAVRPPAIRLLEAHRVSVHARGEDLATLLLDLGRQSPFDFIVDPAVDETVSADLTEVPLLEVLEKLVRARGYRYEISGHLIHVRSDDHETRSYRVGTASLAEDVGFWPELQRTLATLVLRPGHGSVAASGSASKRKAQDLYQRPRKLIVSKPFHLISVTAEQPVLQEVDDYLAEVERATGRVVGRRAPTPWWHRSVGVQASPQPVSDHSATRPVVARTDRWQQTERSADDFAAGLAAHRRGDLDFAIDAYQSAISRDPHFVEAMVNLSRVYADLHDLDRANEMLERAARVRPDYFAIYKSLALIGVRRGDVPGVIDALSRAIVLEPDDVNALSNLGAALILDGRLEEATHWLDEAQRIDPGHLESTLNLALAHDRASRSLRAATYYRRFLEMSIGEDPVRSQVRERLDELGPVLTPAVGSPPPAALAR